MRILQSGSYYLKSIFSLLFDFDKPQKIVSFFLFRHNKPLLIRHKSSNLKFHSRTPMDVWSIKETFVDDFYHFKRSIKPVTGVILDIGAGIGEFAIQAAAACPGCSVIGFEPYKESFNFFQKNVAENGLLNILPVEAAVSSVSGNLVMDTSSGNPLQFRTCTDERTPNFVESLQLIPYLIVKGIPSVEILKLDCEGGEYNILLPLESKDLNRFRFITMEYHDGLTPHNHYELIDHLEKSGFLVSCVPNMVHDNIGFIYAKQMKK